MEIITKFKPGQFVWVILNNSVVCKQIKLIKTNTMDFSGKGKDGKRVENFKTQVEYAFEGENKAEHLEENVFGSQKELIEAYCPNVIATEKEQLEEEEKLGPGRDKNGKRGFSYQTDEDDMIEENE